MCFLNKLKYYSFLIAVFILWLKSVKECLPEIREISGASFLGERSTLRDKLAQIIWDNAESPVSLVIWIYYTNREADQCVYLYCHYQ